VPGVHVGCGTTIDAGLCDGIGLNLGDSAQALLERHDLFHVMSRSDNVGRTMPALVGQKACPVGG
jgi:hypothetical protein